MIEKLYDEFFGTGYWEKQYKQQIVIFAEKCIGDAQNTSSNNEYKQCEYCHDTRLLCSGAGECDHDGRDCSESDNCGEYTPALCKHCTN